MKNLKPKPNLFDELFENELNNERTYYVFDDVDTVIEIQNLYREQKNITPKQLLTAQYLMSKLNYPLMMHRSQNFYLKVNYWGMIDFLCYIAEVRTPEADS